MQRAFWTSVLLTAALAAGGCDNDLDLPIPDPPVMVTDTFTGNIGVNGASTHTFVIAAAGRVTATLTELTPDNTVTVGFALGTWNDTTRICQQVIPKDTATLGEIIVGDTNGPVGGSLCARIYDTGTLTAGIGYTITVEHP